MRRKANLSLANVYDDLDQALDSRDAIKRRKLESILSEKRSNPSGYNYHGELDDDIVTVNPFKVPSFRKEKPIQENRKKDVTTYISPRNNNAASMSLFRRPKILGMKKLFSSWRDKERKDRIQHRKKQYVIEKWRAYTLGSTRVVLSDGLEKFRLRGVCSTFAPVISITSNVSISSMSGSRL